METFVGDTIDLVVDAGVDLSGYSTLKIKFRRPNRSTGSWTALIDPASNNRMYYTTTDPDLNMAGDWILQAYAEDTGIALHGKRTTLRVLDPFPDTSTPPTTAAPTTAIP